MVCAHFAREEHGMDHPWQSRVPDAAQRPARLTSGKSSGCSGLRAPPCPGDSASRTSA
eukprot:CAMPEP_0171192380 /NCGR_PEP_ID=MMETSP0790-20130122/19841_1 /TAXON_ID=2925 /ORGANISM="Alexandrium catenella, Strain OF101" /LENGTH=57 /DNA_ID=CAMNT_0011657539 /DNA_START=17 /DNA_END=186 /DNA_ORIENTATION=+